MTRLNTTFASLTSQGKTALVPFVMAGDGPTLDILDALVAGGADIIELGMPFSDPTADGPVIQAAGLRALAAGMNVAGTLEIAKQFRAKHPAVPLVLMGYYNPILHAGVGTFCAQAKQAGVDGVIVVDLPPEEELELTAPLAAAGISLVRLIAPTSLETRLPLLVKAASGYIYYIAIAGITGAKGADAAEVAQAVAKIRAATNLPVCVGFGIKTAQDAAQLKPFVDGVVVGSALVQRLREVVDKPAEARAMMAEFTAG